MKRVALSGYCLFLLAFPALEGFSNEGAAPGTRVFGGLAFVLFVAYTISRRRVRRLNAGALLGIAMASWQCVSALVSPDPLLSLSALSPLLLSVLFYLIGYALLSEPGALRSAFISYSIGVLLLGLTAVVNIFSADSYQGLYGRFSGVGTDPNNFGLTLASAIPGLVITSQDARSPRVLRLASLFLATGAGAIVLATGSRSSLIGLILILLFLIYRLATQRRFAVLLSSVLLVALVGTVLVDYVPTESLVRLRTEFVDRSAGGRTEAWRLAWELGASHLVFGLGPGRFLYESERILGTGMLPHNTLLSFFAESGLLGAVLWFLFLAWHALAAFRQMRSSETTRIALGMSILPLLVACLSLNWEARKPLYFVCAALSASTLLRHNELKGTASSRVSDLSLGMRTRTVGASDRADPALGRPPAVYFRQDPGAVD